MPRWLDQLRDDLDQRRRQDALRQLTPLDRCARTVRRDGRPLINLASNDYLGLASHPHLRAAVAEAAERFGVGAGASRLVTGHLDLHHALEQRFARFKHAEAALLLPTGYAANVAAVTALASSDDAVFLDKLDHASLIDAARASGAAVRTFPHRRYDRLAELMQRHADARRRIIVTDAVFSMDGDIADLPALCELRDRFDAVLIVDEAHATGVLGRHGAGLAEQQGVAGRVDVTISTAGKALGSLGGIVTSCRLVIDTIVNAGRWFIYTTAAPPTQVAAIDAALDIVAGEPQRRDRLRQLGDRLRRDLHDRGWPVSTSDITPIVPLIVGDNAAALALSRRLDDAGFLAPAIRPPTVAPGAARVRLCLRADLEDADLDRLVDAVGSPPA